MSIHPQSNNLKFPLVASLAQFEHGNIAFACGKGANLGGLIRARFEVPAGFVITTAAYDLFFQIDGLQIQGMIASMQTDNPVSVTEVSQHIRDAIQHASIPDLITDEALKAYRQLEGSAVAVRSSAIAGISRAIASKLKLSKKSPKGAILIVKFFLPVQITNLPSPQQAFHH